MNKLNVRQSNFELLRIVCMISIVTYHIYTQTDVGGMGLEDGVPYVILIFVGYGGRLACNCFVMIGAYFLCDTDFRPQRIVNLWLQVFFYTLSITVICFLLKIPGTNIVLLVQSFLPIMGRPVWFAAEYICMLMFTPFLNVLFQHSEKICIRLLIILGVLIIVCATLFPIEHTTPAFSELIWFLFLYMFVAYFKKHPCIWMQKKSICFWAAAGTYSICVTFYVLLVKFGFGGLASYYLVHYENLFSFASSVFIFLFIKNIDIANVRIINIIGESVFAVYVIHQTPCFYAVLWNGIFSVNQYVGKAELLGYIFIVITMIFVFSIVVENIRKAFFRRFVYTGRLYKMICCKIGRFYEGVEKNAETY